MKLNKKKVINFPRMVRFYKCVIFFFFNFSYKMVTDRNGNRGRVGVVFMFDVTCKRVGP